MVSRDELGNRILQQAMELREQVRSNLRSRYYGNDDIQMRSYNQLVETAAAVYPEDPVLHGEMILMPDAVLEGFSSPLNLLGVGMAPQMPSQRLETRLTQLINRLELVLSSCVPDAPPTKTAGEVLRAERKGELRDIVKVLDDLVRRQSELPAVDSRDFGFVADVSVRALLVADYVEAQRTFSVGAFKASALLSGGLVEGMLLDGLQRPDTMCRPNYKAATNKFPRNASGDVNWDKVSLTALSDAAIQLGILTDDFRRFMDGMRDFRDTVHPRAEIRQQIRAQREEAELLLAVVKLIYRHLSALAGA